MKTHALLYTTSGFLLGLFISITLMFIIFPRDPLRRLFLKTPVQEIFYTENTPLKDIAKNLADQVNKKNNRQIRIIYYPEGIQNINIKYMHSLCSDEADRMAWLVANAYACNFAYVDKNTLLFYMEEDRIEMYRSEIYPKDNKKSD